MGNKHFLKEINMRLDEYESGNNKTSSWEELKQKPRQQKRLMAYNTRFHTAAESEYIRA